MMTEEQGNQIIELLEDLNRNLRNIDEKLPRLKMIGNKDINDVYDRLGDVLSAVDNVESAIISNS